MVVHFYPILILLSVPYEFYPQFKARRTFSVKHKQHVICSASHIVNVMKCKCKKYINDFQLSFSMHDFTFRQKPICHPFLIVPGIHVHVCVFPRFLISSVLQRPGVLPPPPPVFTPNLCSFVFVFHI